MAKGDHLSLVTSLDAALHDSGNQLLRHAKNLAWELKSDAPMFGDGTIEAYWISLSTKVKLQYVYAAEAVVLGMIRDIDRSQAVNNAMKLWLQSQLEGE